MISVLHVKTELSATSGISLASMLIPFHIAPTNPTLSIVSLSGLFFHPRPSIGHPLQHSFEPPDMTFVNPFSWSSG
jgi:hypothetical protein